MKRKILKELQNFMHLVKACGSCYKSLDRCGISFHATCKIGTGRKTYPDGSPSAGEMAGAMPHFDLQQAHAIRPLFLERRTKNEKNYFSCFDFDYELQRFCLCTNHRGCHHAVAGRHRFNVQRAPEHQKPGFYRLCPLLLLWTREAM